MKSSKKFSSTSKEIRETPFEAIWERFNGRTAIVPHLGLNKEIHFENTFAYVEHILRTKTHNKGLLILVMPDADASGAADIPKLAERVNQRLDEV